jgi:hypothetical protein
MLAQQRRTAAHEIDTVLIVRTQMSDKTSNADVAHYRLARRARLLTHP